MAIGIFSRPAPTMRMMGASGGLSSCAGVASGKRAAGAARRAAITRRRRGVEGTVSVSGVPGVGALRCQVEDDLHREAVLRQGNGALGKGLRGLDREQQGTIERLEAARPAQFELLYAAADARQHQVDGGAQGLVASVDRALPCALDLALDQGEVEGVGVASATG